MLKRNFIYLVLAIVFSLGINSPVLSQIIKSQKSLNELINLKQKEVSNKTMMIVARKATRNIFVDIPISTTDTGHTFIAILEYKDRKIIKYTTYGKYPAGLLTNGKDDYADMTKIVNNQDLVRLRFEELPMNDQQYQSILKINKAEGYYDLFSANCAHYTSKIMNVFLWYHNGISLNTENPAKYHAFFKNRRVQW